MIKWLIKAAVAGVNALIILNIFSFLYYNVPLPEDNPTGATDYVWESGKFYSRATEGFAYGMIDNGGFKNSYNFSDVDKIEILIMGSSHMEAYQISQRQNVSSQLNNLFNGNKLSYNIGISGHTLLHCISNLEDALSFYSPTEYLIIETSTVTFSEIDIESVLDHSIKKLSSLHSGRLGYIKNTYPNIYRLYKVLPYVSLIYSQLQNVNNSKQRNEVDLKLQEEDGNNYEQLLNRLMEKTELECAERNVVPIIIFHPSIVVDTSGEPYANTDENKLNLFSAACEKNSIIFLDMTNTFINNYKKNYTLPHGFFNTSAGEGHLNKYGHKMIAEKLFEIITELEN